MKFFDTEGISPNATAEYVAALGVEDATPIAAEHRITMLKRLREGAGVRVITGPEGCEFWLPVSVEVRIVVAPDGYEMQDRCEANLEWALRVQGLTDLAARGLAKRFEETGKEPTPKAKVYPKWEAAKELLEAYSQYTDEYGSIIVEASHIEAVTTEHEQLALLDTLQGTPVGMDYEWNIAPEYPLYQPEGFSVATADRTWYFPLKALDFELPDEYGDVLRRKVMERILDTPTVWHNAKADLGSQWLGAPLDAFGAPLHDTLVMAFVAGEHELSLKALGRSRLGRDPLDYPGAMRTLSLETCRRYGGADARNTYDLFADLYRTLNERSQMAIYEDIERPIVPLLTDMERYGLPIDVPRLRVVRDILDADAERIRQFYLDTEKLDIAKDKDIRELVKRRTGYDPGTVKEAALAKHEGEWMDNIIRFRKVRHRKRSFAEKHIAKWEALGEPTDFRLMTSFNQAGAADQHEQRSFKKAPRSGRLSSSSPDYIYPGLIGAPGGNNQNQPNEGVDGTFMAGVPGLKDIYVAPPGNLLWAIDYKQLEIRIAAARSRDPNLMEAVQSEDGPHVDFVNRIHRMTGQKIAKVAAKQGNFNAQYGGHVDMLRTILQKQRVFMADPELLTIVEAHKEAYAGYHGYTDQVVAFARQHGYSETAFGRRRYDEDVFSTDTRIRLHAERALINHTIQGTAADMLKAAMRLAVPVMKHYGAHMALQVHDEIMGWCPEEVIEDFYADLCRVIQPVQLPGVEFGVDGGYGRSWKDAKP